MRRVSILTAGHLPTTVPPGYIGPVRWRPMFYLTFLGVSTGYARQSR